MKPRVGIIWISCCLTAWIVCLLPDRMLASVVLQSNLTAPASLSDCPNQRLLEFGWRYSWGQQLNSAATSAAISTTLYEPLPDPSKQPHPARRAGNSAGHHSALNEVNSFGGPLLMAVIANRWNHPWTESSTKLFLWGNCWVPQLFVSKIMKVPIASNG